MTNVCNQKTMKSEIIYEGKILTLRVDTVELLDMKYARREIIEQRPAVVIVAIDNDGNFLFVRQFRKAAETELLELPAGKIEYGESPLEAAHRELREETKYDARTLDLLFEAYASPGYSTEKMYFFLARELFYSPLQEDEDEDISLERYTRMEIEHMMQNGLFGDCKTVAGLLFQRIEWRFKCAQLT